MAVVYGIIVFRSQAMAECAFRPLQLRFLSLAFDGTVCLFWRKSGGLVGMVVDSVP